MTDQVEAELKSLGTQALQDLMNNLTQAKGFVLEQAPEFCQQLVARGMWMPAFVSMICTIGAIVGLAACIIITWRATRKGEWEVWQGVTALYGSIGVVALALAAIVKAHAALAVYVAPKVYLVEEIARMLK